MSFQVGVGSLGGTVFFSGGTLYSSANYEVTWHMCIVYICIYLAHFIFKKILRVAEGVSKYLPTKHAMKLRKFPHFFFL